MDFLAMKNRYSMLGRDFLTWLYRRAEANEGQIPEAGNGVEIFFDDSVSLVGEGDSPARTSLSGDPATMESELVASLKSGKKILRAKLHIIGPGGEWSMSLDTDDWSVRSLKLPTGIKDGSTDETMILDRMGSLEKVEEVLEELFSAYLDVRTDGKAYEAHGEDLTGWLKGAELN
jgi:hypothetical protein